MKESLIKLLIAVSFQFMFALAIMCGWNWVIAKGFGLKDLNYWLAFGVLLFLECITMKVTPKDDELAFEEYVVKGLVGITMMGIFIGLFALVSMGI